jgi:nicotinate-nucleotide adenylyltransferase
MTRLAVRDAPCFEADDIEVRREGPSYTVDTLHTLQKELSAGDELFFMLGEDALADLPFWHDPAGIAAAARIAVIPREGIVLSELPFPPERMVHVQMPYIGISSTLLRQRVGACRSEPALSGTGPG